MTTENYFERTAGVMERLANSPPAELDGLVDSILSSWRADGKVVSCGNGGSASDSQHFVTELVARYNRESINKPALSLTADTSTITAISNDWSYEEVFSRQVTAHLNSEDTFLGITTSGDSENVIRALRSAREIGADCYALTGTSGGRLRGMDCTIISVPSDRTPHIQEAHTACLHYVCEVIDEELNN